MDREIGKDGSETGRGFYLRDYGSRGEREEYQDKVSRGDSECGF